MTYLSKRRFRPFFQFAKFILPYRTRWVLLLFLNGLTAALALVNPAIAKFFIDQLIGPKNTKILVLLVLIGTGVLILGELIQAYSKFVDKTITLKVTFDIHKRVFEHIEHLPLSWFEKRSTGENLYTLGVDADRVSELVTTAPPGGVFILARLLFTTIVIFYLNWKMALLSLLLAPFLLIPQYHFGQLMERAWRAFIESSQKIYENLQETFSHIKVVKAFGAEALSIAKHLEIVAENIKREMKNTRLDIFRGLTTQTVTTLTIGIITLYGGYQVINWDLTLGTFTALMVYLRQMAGLQNELTHFVQTVTLGLLSCRRVAEILEERPQVAEAKETKQVTLRGHPITFENVTFGYGKEDPVLRGVHLQIEAGRHTAIAGPSGCGKTTLLLLLLRLYDPRAGRISIDGHDIKELGFDSLREAIGVALQEPLLWNDSVANNIRFSKDQAPRDEIIRVSELTGAHEFIRLMPEGYDTVIGENACRLSEGQKQKIAIARALVKRPNILILDEAMASIDSESEDRILKNIRRHFPHLALITVSHRFSTVKNADGVAFFSKKEGRIVVQKIEDISGDEEFSDLFASQTEPSLSLK